MKEARASGFFQLSQADLNVAGHASHRSELEAAQTWVPTATPTGQSHGCLRVQWQPTFNGAEAAVATQQLHVHVNLAAPQATLFRRLQHQLDVTKVLQVGCEIVTEQEVTERRAFGAFIPADGAQLTHDAAREQAQEWLLRCFLRDSIEATGLFIDECLTVCAVMRLSTGITPVSGENLTTAVESAARAAHRAGFVPKIDLLRTQYGIATPFDSHLRSLIAARNCVVHRLGNVSEKDVDALGVLRVSLLHFRALAVGVQTGREYEVRPGMILPEASNLCIQFLERHRDFSLGESLQFMPHELYDTIITLYRYGQALGSACEEFGRSLGIQFSETPPDVTLHPLSIPFL